MFNGVVKNSTTRNALDEAVGCYITKQKKIDAGRIQTQLPRVIASGVDEKYPTDVVNTKNK